MYNSNAYQFEVPKPIINAAQSANMYGQQYYPIAQPLSPTHQNPVSPSPALQDLTLARSYVPVQAYVGILPLEEGFKRGSSFPNLYQPYKKIGGRTHE